MPDPINFSISVIHNIDVSNNLQNLNHAAVAARTVNLEELVKKNQNAKNQVKNTEEKAKSQNIKDDQKRNFSENRKQKKEKKELEEKKEKRIIDDYRGHSIDIRI
ncbi:MAG: hypothetical protein B6I29_05395 [Marinitoga sp. 4572_148]|nr:MAG: hypothetical protein B6I29_05395 [Marinitoga sp. 4572_148]